jgi:hypothetical protein
MPFEKGVSGNKNGRPAGSKNKLNSKVKEVLADALEKEVENIESLLHQLEPKERVDAITKLLPFFFPKLQAQQITIDAEVVEKKRPSFMSEGDVETKHLYN